MVGIGMGMGVHFVTEPIAEVVPDVGWLKGTYSATQASDSGISRTPTLDSHTRESNDYYRVTCKIYLQNATGDNWGTSGSTPNETRTYMQYGGYGTSQNIVPDTLTEFDQTSSNIPSATYSQWMRIYWPVLNDRPNAGAIFWIKDLVLRVYGVGNNLKATYTSDFTSSVNGWTVYSVNEGTLNLEYNQEFLT